jgi:tetratricopeptide (TPR) repeat protein
MTTRIWIGVLCAVLTMGIVVTEGLADEPVFVKWLLMEDPGDRAIAEYWQRHEAGELDVDGMIDLGTMLFYRGYPKDAVRVFRAALDVDKDLAEAWFRIGLVEHHQGELREARRAYERCLRKFKGHGWCNFYLGLLEEQAGNAVQAMEHFQNAFRYAPVLADPTVNPEMTSSEIAFGARLEMMKKEAFSNNLPLPFMDPEEVKDARRKKPGAEEKPADASGASATVQPDGPGEDPSADAVAEPEAAAAATAVTAAEQKRPVRGSRTPGESPPKPLKAQPTPVPPSNTSDLPYGIPGGITTTSSEASLRGWWNEVREFFA